ncbi:MAG: hypothetical protein R2776_04520 [Flavobacteriaceae bacterium]|nr:hypothetical protein [Flavobacteriaceae bacterium]
MIKQPEGFNMVLVFLALKAVLLAIILKIVHNNTSCFTIMCNSKAEILKEINDYLKL